jgi:hypothetical protein
MTLTEAAFRADLIRTCVNQVGHLYRDSAVPTNWPPQQFDCSVLMNWAHHKHGLDIDLGKKIDTNWPEPEPRPWHKYRGYTGTQKSAARRLDADILFKQRKPGDRLYYDSDHGYHVVMFIGDDQVVHAAGTAYGVIISPLVYPDTLGHGGKKLALVVSATKFARACGYEFKKNPQGIHRIQIGGRTALKRDEIIRQSGMSRDYFARRNGHLKENRFYPPTTPVWVPTHVTRIDASNNPR